MEESPGNDDIVAHKSEAYDSRCYGLVPGVAYQDNFKTSVAADYVTKANGPFYCRECLSEAIVRKCSDKDDHFAHKARLSPTGRRGNTEFHHQVRDELCSILNVHFPDGKWQTEKQLKGDSSWRADIAGYFGRPTKEAPAVAIEVQCSPYSPTYIRKKSAAYTARNVNVLWIVPLTKELGDTEFRPRRYELFLHTMYLGYVFYYMPGSKGLLTPVHYGPAFRYIEPRTFFDKEANENNVGDYHLKYKTQKKPTYNDAKRQVPIFELVARSLNAWENPNNEKLNVPERKIMAINSAKWWPENENKEWLKNNDWFRYVKEYLPYYVADDENDEYADD